MTEDDIRAKAYALWIERGSPEGSPEVDWFAAKEFLAGQAEISLDQEALQKHQAEWGITGKEL